MPPTPTTSSTSEPWTSELRAQCDVLLDKHRSALQDCVNGLSEAEARMSLVPSRTTLLGLIKHVIVVERVYFDQAITGRTSKEMGVASTPDRSFALTKDDTITSLQTIYRETCAAFARSHSCTSPTWSKVAVRGRCGRSTYRCCASLLPTADTPTYSASRFSLHEAASTAL